MRITPELRLEIEERITERAGPAPAFFVLMVLSTLIASYGLLSNSTATVIGAMLVAPLMGPILGLALSLATGRPDLFLRALRAEVLGILVCLGASALVALLAGPGNIDYLQSEIANRTQPTLYDLAIGLAAGLAGAYATVNTRVGDSIGGVAIAVALVPPLSVCGLSLAGGLSGRDDLWPAAGGSFILFLANFLTIELAAASLFLSVGLGHVRELKRSRGLLRGLGVQLLLLMATLAFLATQLDGLLERRRLERLARSVAVAELAGMPGASLDSLFIRRQREVLRIEMVVRAPRETDAALVAHLQQELTRNLGREVELGVGTILSTYYTSEGRRYAAPSAAPDPEQVRRLAMRDSLRRALEDFPSAELDSFRLLDERHALVTVRSSYEFDAPLVEELENSARRAHGDGPFPSLTVRTLLSRDYDAAGEVIPGDAVHQLRRRLQAVLEARVEELPGGRLLRSQIVMKAPPSNEDAPLPTPVLGGYAGRTVEVRAVVRTESPVTPELVGDWERALREELGTRVNLEVDNRLGRTVRGGARSSPSPPEGAPPPAPPR